MPLLPTLRIVDNLPIYGIETMSDDHIDLKKLRVDNLPIYGIETWMGRSEDALKPLITFPFMGLKPYYLMFSRVYCVLITFPFMGLKLEMVE